MLQEVDFTLGGALNPEGNPSSPIPGVDRQLTQVLTTVQPFAQFDWKALPDLTLSPGVRYDHFERSVDSQVNVKTGLPRSPTRITSTPPCLRSRRTTRSRATGATYAQVAKGFLKPNENFFNYNANPASTSVSPQQSWNYQLGTSWQTRALSLAADVYYIDFKNLIGSQTIGGNTVFFNQGGVTYKGVEAEATQYLGMGFSVYANGSINSAKNKQTGQWIADAPDATFTAGAIEQPAGLVRVVARQVGGQVLRRHRPDPAHQLVQHSRRCHRLHRARQRARWLAKASLKLSFNNLLDSRKIIALAGYTAADGTPLYWTMPERSVFLTLSVPF